MNTNDPMTQERLDAIQERVDKSSWTEHEPWSVYDDGLTVSVWVKNGSAPVTFVADRFLRGEDNGEADATLTTHAPQDLTDLLAEVERLRALTTVDKDKVERGARAFYEHPTPGVDDSLRTVWDRLTKAFPDVADNHRRSMTAALDAVLGTGEGA